MENIIGILVRPVIVLVLLVVFVVVFRWLWNITVPEVFALKPISFWQTFRIWILASILFGGVRVIERGAEMAPDAGQANTRAGARAKLKNPADSRPNMGTPRRRPRRRSTNGSKDYKNELS